jgi:hypothetical protein
MPKAPSGMMIHGSSVESFLRDCNATDGAVARFKSVWHDVNESAGSAGGEDDGKHGRWRSEGEDESGEDDQKEGGRRDEKRQRTTTSASSSSASSASSTPSSSTSADEGETWSVAALLSLRAGAGPGQPSASSPQPVPAPSPAAVTDTVGDAMMVTASPPPSSWDAVLGPVDMAHTAFVGAVQASDVPPSPHPAMQPEQVNMMQHWLKTHDAASQLLVYRLAEEREILERDYCAALAAEEEYHRSRLAEHQQRYQHQLQDAETRTAEARQALAELVTQSMMSVLQT